MIYAILWGIIRHILTSVGGALLWHGLETATHSHTAVGAVLTVAGMFLSAKSKTTAYNSQIHGFDDSTVNDKR